MQNLAEAFVARIARRSFLSLWSYANPVGKNGKELCDILAVCDPDVIIFSVKDISVTETGDLRVDWGRWQREAVSKSAKQIYGAERWLRAARHVIRADRTPGIALPDLSHRRVHRIAVALGGRGRVPIHMGDFGKGFIHVISDESIEAILGELDTVEDLSNYLLAKEALCQGGTHVNILGNEQDLLAIYLQGERCFPTGQDILMVEDGIWDNFIKRPEYVAKKEADRDSYTWDRLVDYISEEMLNGRMEIGSDLNENELCIRVMARENRFARRGLGKSFKQFLDQARDNKIGSRFTKSPSGLGYVFLVKPHGYSRDARRAELSNRCFVARGLNPDCTTVVGIATEKPQRGKGFSIDVAHLYIPEWTPENQTIL
ncbi:MAG: NERD domain-containing protein [Candidatus Saganbacteria bacterium]|nr:NERD domain-containing protein [Candidatus Saganbacteria bacterium]